MSNTLTRYGTSALANNTTGANNSAFGHYAAYNNTDASCNTAIGSCSSFYNVHGKHNTAIGAGSMCNNVGGELNTAVGSSALEGQLNPPAALVSVGDHNVAIGAQALYNNTDASANTAIGTFSGYYNTNGQYNTFIGFDADVSNNGTTPYEYSTALGCYATIDASNQIVLGGKNASGSYPSIYIPGTYVGIHTYNPGNGFTLDVSGNLNTTMDASINSITVGRGGGNVSTNTAVGFDALISNTTFPNNTAIGYLALALNDASNNTAVGSAALANNTSGHYNTAVGTALVANKTGILNTATGFRALLNNITGYYNTSVGSYALFNNRDGSGNTAIGFEAGFDVSGNSNNNTFLGNNADVSSNTLIYNNSTALGYSATIDASNQIVLGTSNEKVKIPGSYVGIGGVYNPSPGLALDVDGSANFTGRVNALSFNTTSDYRIKENVIQLDSKFIVDNLNPVTYLNNKLGKQDIGLIAHELQDIYPELVNGEKDGEQFQSVNYIGLIPILIKEIQVLKERVKILEERN